jgi:hypothetical protein
VTTPGRLAALRTALTMAALQARHRRCAGYREMRIKNMDGWACLTHRTGDGLLLDEAVVTAAYGLTLAGLEDWCAQMRAAGAPGEAMVLGELAPEPVVPRRGHRVIRVETPAGSRLVVRLTGFPRSSIGKAAV